MPRPFFPDSVVLAWAFYLALVSITVVATYTDLRYLQIPKWLTLPALALGVLFNIVLGAWTGAEVMRGRFLFGGEGGFTGALDGLMLSVTGCLTGFGLFFVMFVLGTCRGGDVKLFAAVGAWVGPILALIVLIGTVVAVVVMGVAHLAWNMATHGFGRTYKDYTLRGAAKQRGKKNEPKTTRARLTAYSPAVAISAAVVLFVMFRSQLHVLPEKGQTAMTPTRTAQR
jgi:Flp pilus assembly protein protease CpaA